MIQQGKASNLDVYAFSSYPNGEIPMQLHNLDIVHLPVSKTVVSLTGAIHRPLKYDVLDGECLSDMIHFGGGLLASANVQYAKLFRYTENVQLQIDIYLPPYLAGKSCFTFQPGDSLVFKEINELSQNRIKISGAVLFPGFYGLDSSKTIHSLFKKAILSEGASKDQFILLRKDDNEALGIKKMSLKASEGFVDVELMAGDEIIIDFKSKFKGVNSSAPISLGCVRVCPSISVVIYGVKEALAAAEFRAGFKTCKSVVELKIGSTEIELLSWL